MAKKVAWKEHSKWPQSLRFAAPKLKNKRVNMEKDNSLLRKAVTVQSCTQTGKSCLLKYTKKYAKIFA